jgi:hypothetical protein
MSALRPRLESPLRRACGFTLFEMAIVTALGSAMMIALLVTLQAWALQAQSQLAGQQYKRINEAVGDYLSLHYARLRALPDECSQVALAYGVALNPDPVTVRGGCRLSLPGDGATVQVSNGLQPTLDELKNLKILDRGVSIRPLLSTQQTIYQPTAAGAQSQELAPATYAIQIRKTCPSQPCGDVFYLSALTFNTQPYAPGNPPEAIRAYERIENAFLAAGSDALLSLPASLNGDGELHGFKDSSVLPNPLRNYTGTSPSVGVEGILAVRTGFGSATLAQFARRDGSSPVTGNWNFDGHEISGLRVLNTTEVRSEKVESRTLNISESGTVKTLTTEALTAKSVTAEEIKLPAGVLGAACPAAQSIAVSTTGGQLLVCSAARVWVSPTP